MTTGVTEEFKSKVLQVASSEKSTEILLEMLEGPVSYRLSLFDGRGHVVGECSMAYAYEFVHLLERLKLVNLYVIQCPLEKTFTLHIPEEHRERTD